jgi:hypothetical protein
VLAAVLPQHHAAAEAIKGQPAKCTHFAGERVTFTAAASTIESDSQKYAMAAGCALTAMLPELKALADLPVFFCSKGLVGSCEWRGEVQLDQGQVLMQLPKLRALHSRSPQHFQQTYPVSESMEQNRPWQLSGLQQLALHLSMQGGDPVTDVLLNMLPHTQQLRQISLASWGQPCADAAAAVLRALAQLPQLKSIGLPASLLCQECSSKDAGAAAAAAGGAVAAAAARYEGLYAALEALAVKPSVAVLAFLRPPVSGILSRDRCRHGGQQRQTLARLQQTVSCAAKAAAFSTGGTTLAAVAAADAGPAVQKVARAQLRVLTCDEFVCWADGHPTWRMDERSTGKGAWGVFGPVREW